MIALPSHRQLALPLLEVLRENDGITPSEAADRVAKRLGLPDEVRRATIPMPRYSRRGVNTFERRLRWAKQSHVDSGFVASKERARWHLTDAGAKFCQEARPGLMVTVFETDNGAAVWAEFQTAMGAIADGQLQACITSTPYPILKGRAYGRMTPEACVAMIEEMFQGLRRKLTADGSVVINLAPVWLKGIPARSIYQHELLVKLVKEHGFYLCDEHPWHSPSKPAVTDWVTKRRERCRSSMESFYWLSPTPHPYADNRQVLVPYGETMRRTLARGGDGRTTRPSGHGHTGPSYSVDNGGSIPPNFFNVSNAASNTFYHRECRRLRLPLHPATFPDEVCDFFVKFLSRPGDLVADLCGGSLKLAEACERHGRRWFSSERFLPYIRGGQSRFLSAPGFHSLGIPGEPISVLPLPR